MRMMHPDPAVDRLHALPRTIARWRRFAKIAGRRGFSIGGVRVLLQMHRETVAVVCESMGITERELRRRYPAAFAIGPRAQQ